MESERPRVSISATGPYVRAPTTLSRLSSAGAAVPIRAPLTIDDDDETDEDEGSGSESDVLNSVSSDDSQEMDSGTDEESESGSVDPDYDTAEDDEIGVIRVPRPFREDPDAENGDSSGVSGRSRVDRPFVGSQNEEMSVNSCFGEEESDGSSNEVDSSTTKGVSFRARVVIPRARLSLDDDEVGEISSGEDDDHRSRVVKVLRYSGEEVEDRSLKLGESGVMDKPSHSGSTSGEFVALEDEMMHMNYSDNSFASFGTIEEKSGDVAQEDIDELVVESEGNFDEAGKGENENINLLSEKLGNQGIIIEETDRIADSGTCEGSGGEPRGEDAVNMLGEAKDCGLDNSFISSGATEEKSGDIAPEDSDEFLVESGGNFDEAGKGTNENINPLIERLGNQGIIIEETGCIDDSSACEEDVLMIPAEGSAGLGSGELRGEDSVNMLGEAKDCLKNDSGFVNGLGRPECEAESEFDTQISESFRMAATQCSLNMANHEVAGGVDVSPSYSDSTDLKVEPESETEVNQDLEEIEIKLLPLDESVSGSNYGSSIETSDQTPDNSEQSSPQVNNQVAPGSDCEFNQISVKVEGISTSGNCSVITDEEMENERQIEQLIHDQALEEFDEFAENNGRREKPLHSTLLSVSEKSYPERLRWQIRKEENERIQNLRILKTKLLRIIRRLGLSADDSIVTEVLCKLTLASGERRSSHGFHSESDSDVTKTMQLDAEGPDDLDFSINVLVLGKTGVGKSATINSLFGETKSPVGAFGLTTKSAEYIVGKVGGVGVRVLDTPGLRSSASKERVNRKVLQSIKRRMRTFPADIILYIDRLDEHPGNNDDVLLLQTITSCLGPSIWRNTIVVLTHAASTVPETSSYKDFVTRRTFHLCESIRQAVPEMRSSTDNSMMPRVVLAENNKSKLFPENKTGEFTSLIWRSQLLLLCFSAKIMSETTSHLQKNETMMEKSDLLGSPLRSFALFCSLWNMLVHRAHPRQFSCSHDDNGGDLERKIRHFLDSQSETIWDVRLQQHTSPVNRLPGDEEKRVENGEMDKGFGDRAGLNRVGSLRGRRRRLGLQVKPGFVHGLKTGFCAGSGRDSRPVLSVGTDEEGGEEGRILMKMRGSMAAVLGVVPLLMMSAFSCVYGGN